MTPAQKTALVDALGIEDEVELAKYLDTMEPQSFISIPRFGMAYVQYVRELRGYNVKTKIDVLDPSSDLEDVLCPPYIRESPLFQPLSDGRVDCRLTFTLPQHQARWLEGLIVRLPEMYPNEPKLQDIGWHLAQQLLILMKSDTKRHGAMGANASGTMTPEELKNIQ